MSKARLVVTAITVEQRSPAQVAATHGVSRSWIYELLAHYRAEGHAAFEPRSRRPHSSPRAVPESPVELIVRLRHLQLRTTYHHPDPVEGPRRAEALLEWLHTCPIPEIVRLGRTLRAWRVEFLARVDIGGATNGPTAAINLLVEKIRRVGHGYRNLDNYRLRLLLHCGVVWHTPRTPRIRNRSPRLVLSRGHVAPRRISEHVAPSERANSSAPDTGGSTKG